MLRLNVNVRGEPCFQEQLGRLVLQSSPQEQPSRLSVFLQTSVKRLRPFDSWCRPSSVLIALAWGSFAVDKMLRGVGGVIRQLGSALDSIGAGIQANMAYTETREFLSDRF
jgi:hypothetical protein